MSAIGLLAFGYAPLEKERYVIFFKIAAKRRLKAVRILLVPLEKAERAEGVVKRRPLLGLGDVRGIAEGTQGEIKMRVGDLLLLNDQRAFVSHGVPDRRISRADQDGVKMFHTDLLSVKIKGFLLTL